MNSFGPGSLAIVGLSILLLPAVAAPAQEAKCGACEVAHERCAANCFGGEKKEGFAACMIGCDNTAAQCSCDEEVTLRSEDLVEKSSWISSAAPACHSTTPCGSGYTSCASWSGYSDCDAPFCSIAAWCAEECVDPPPIGPGCFGPAMRQYRERFRVCFNEAMQACTEYQRTMTTVLGCGC